MLRQIILILIIALGLSLRLYGINWDFGFHLHPDERAIVMIIERVHWPTVGEWRLLLTPESPFNFHFFAYGSLPLYLLKFTGYLMSLFDATWKTYGKINILGRILSSLFDSGTIVIVYFISKKLISLKGYVYLPALFYSILVLPIQLSHFFAVDTFLTFFILLNVYLLLSYLNRPSLAKLIFMAFSSALAVTSKFTGIILLPLNILIIFTNKNSGSLFLNYLIRFVRSSLFIVVFILFSFIFMPYAFIDFTAFKQDLGTQLMMSRDAYLFPYTLQYVNTTPYLYPLKHVFNWGVGPFISVMSILGLASLIVKTVNLLRFKYLMTIYKTDAITHWIILLLFPLFYFLIIGGSAVKFMRYYLPLYPFISLLAGYFFYQALSIINARSGKISAFLIEIVFLGLSLIWPISFINIYKYPNTRLMATNWIKSNIPSGSYLAIEHWDDRLPLFSSERYNILTMPMYDPDFSKEKWDKIEDNLNRADYLILASNRLYKPLQRLNDCGVIKSPERCYPRTAQYYQDLFSGNLGFKKTAEFTNYPYLSIFNLHYTFIDDDADENFTVFDHPKIIIFKKITNDI